MVHPVQLTKIALQAVCCILLGLGFATPVVAQSGVIKSVVQDFDQYREQALQEKLFLHIDRSAYACGEIMWFKIYNVDGTLHKPLDLSKVAYVEVLDAAQKPVLQGKVALKDGMGNGSFILPTTLNSGSYKVRAYTNWMKNFSPAFYFEQPVTILNTFKNLEATATQAEDGYSIQFFPEGGNLVAGAITKVAFKIADKRSGKGVALQGELYDQDGNKIADITPYKFGIGHFTFTPVKGQTYKATLKLPTGKILEQQLPKIYEQGYSLRLEENGEDQLKIIVTQAGLEAEQVYLLGHTRQMIAVADATALNQGAAVFLVDKKALADGITHFTLFNAQKQPVSERLYFKRQTERLQLNIEADKEHYVTRQKLKLDLRVNTSTGSSATANLSLAVFRLDSIQRMPEESIESYLWLSSDLKGAIEQPAYYFSEAGATDSEAMDNLMLTHGWSRFKWDEILNKEPAVFTFVPEYNGHWIMGKVTDATTGAPAPGITTYLTSPGKHINLYSAKSDANGTIRYEVKDLFGAKEIIVQTNFLQDSTYRFEIFSPFSDKFTSGLLPDLKLSESMEDDIMVRHLQAQAQHAYFGEHLNQFSSPGIDSIAFYGHADEKYLLDDYKRFRAMEEVMREYVPGVQVRLNRGNFRFMVFDRPHETIFQGNPLVLLDGLPVFDINKIMAFDPLKVKELDVVTSKFFSGPLTFDGIVSLTTYQGNLAGFELDPRSLLQEYEGLQLHREFYAPTYETRTQSRLADFRSLLLWEPDLKLKNGESKAIEFYTSEQVGTYLVLVQGITGSGLAGSKMIQVNVGKPL